MSKKLTTVEPDKQPENNTVSQTSHELFGSMMKESLIPLNLEVETSYEIGKGPPKLDVLIIRRTGPRWSKAQLEFLPDGIRQSKCKHVIVELKYTESINPVAIFQTLGYLASYVKLKALKMENVRAFIASSKSPQDRVLEQINFEKSDIKGVYRSKDILLKPIQLISLNDLSEAHYNLWIKLFSSKATQKYSVLKKLISLGLKKFGRELLIIFIKILNFWNDTGELTMEQIRQKVLYDTGNLNDKEISTFLSLFKPEDVFRQYRPEERLRGLKPEEVFKQYRPEDVLKQYRPEDRLRGLKPEERLKGLDFKTIETYLAKAKKQKKKK